MLFGMIPVQIVDFPIAGRFRLQTLADDLVVADPHRRLAAVLGEHPDHRFARFGDNALGQYGPEVLAVQIEWSFQTGRGAQGREPIGKVTGYVAHRTGLDAAGQADNQRHADAALVQTAFVAAQPRGTVEKRAIHTADMKVRIRQPRMRRAVVAGKDDQGVVGDACLFERFHHASDVTVQVGDHRGIAGPRPGMRQIAALPTIDLGIPLGRKPLDRFARRMHGHMRLDERQIQKEGLRVVGFQKLDRFGDHQLRRVGLPDPILQTHFALRLPLVSRDWVGVDRYPLGVPPQMRRIETVRDTLAVIAEEQIEPLAVRIARAADRAESPFAHRRGGVTGLLENLSHRQRLFRQRILAFGEFRKSGLNAEVAAHFRMSQMLARHQRAAGRGTNRRPGVVAGETHPLRRQPVDVRRRDLLLTVAAQFAPAEIVSQNEHDIQPRRVSGLSGLPAENAYEHRNGQKCWHRWSPAFSKGHALGGYRRNQSETRASP